MPSQSIVQTIYHKVHQQLTPAVPKKWKHQFSFGFQAYALKPFQSAAGNARMTVFKPSTALRKAERLFNNTQLTDQLGSIFDGLGLVKPNSFVSVDHSDMNQLTALVGAIQTRKGRSIPCFIETTYSDRIPSKRSGRSTPRKASLRAARAEARRTQSFTGHTIDALQDFADRLGFWPKLVFDRGFGNESIVEHLNSQGATFYIRMKARRYVQLVDPDTGLMSRIEIKNLKDKDTTIQLYGLTLRVIRSPKSRRAPEPWYILTNDMTYSRNKIVKIYYYRFEVEETFKDVKHIFEFRRTRLNKPNSLKLILWFISIGIALLYLATKPTRSSLYASHPKKRTSWLRQAYEQLRAETTQLLWGGV